MNCPALIIAGPTASGKSALALAAAQALNGVVINADSMQLYDALPTLTAQPPPEEQSAAPHKLYGVLPPAAQADAAAWREMAIAEMRAAAHQGQIPIIVGGTGFYIKALAKGLSPIPNIPPAFRAAAVAAWEKQGTDGLYQDLLAADPLIKDKIDPKNPMRLMRAHEVFYGTGKSLVAWQELPLGGPPAGFRFVHVTVLPDRDWLYERCNKRFDMMIAQGALEEVRRLHDMIANGAVAADAAITRAIGYKELAACLDGRMEWAAACASARQATRNYAKRQITWGRNQTDSDMTFQPDRESADAALARIMPLLHD